VLFYRKDLLDKYSAAVPTTWQALTETARRIQSAERAAGNDRLWGYVWQGRAYEGLTCNALEWVHGFGGGTLVDNAGQVTTDNPALAQALALAASWVGDISPPGVLNYDEEASRGVFQSGQAVFMRNWPYAWALAQSEDSPVRDKVGVAALPGTEGGAARSGTLGGWQLAVSRHSRYPEVAASLVMHLSSEAEQKRRAIAGSYNPTRPALYDDPDVLAATPFFGELKETFEHAVARPSRATGAQYNRVSAEFWGAVHSTLSGQASAGQSQQRLTRNLQRLQRRGW
jgi:trehalose/maltose transport system substrate-binding protein